MTPTFVIAEIGSCHDGHLSRALALVGAAADAGADAVKVQYWSDANELADRRRVPDYYRQLYARYRLPEVWLQDIRAECDRRAVRLVITSYLPRDVRLVAVYADDFKVASFEAEASDLLNAHIPYVTGPQGRRLIISLGMGAKPAIMTATARYLRCVSAYPAPVSALNLASIRPHNGTVGGLAYDGLSDHTDPSLTWTGALAVAAGATIVEAHLRLFETDDRNPDAPHAMHPGQFRDYVRHIRFAVACCGDAYTATTGPLPCEADMANYRVRLP